MTPRPDGGSLCVNSERTTHQRDTFMSEQTRRQKYSCECAREITAGNQSYSVLRRTINYGGLRRNARHKKSKNVENCSC